MLLKDTSARRSKPIFYSQCFWASAVELLSSGQVQFPYSASWPIKLSTCYICANSFFQWIPYLRTQSIIYFYLQGTNINHVSSSSASARLLPQFPTFHRPKVGFDLNSFMCLKALNVQRQTWRGWRPSCFIFHGIWRTCLPGEEAAVRQGCAEGQHAPR